MLPCIIHWLHINRLKNLKWSQFKRKKIANHQIPTLMTMQKHITYIKFGNQQPCTHELFSCGNIQFLCKTDQRA